MRQKKRFWTLRIVSVLLAVSALYALLSFFFFHHEITVNQTSRRSAQWILRSALTVTNNMVDQLQELDMKKSPDPSSVNETSKSADGVINSTLQESSERVLPNKSFYRLSSEYPPKTLLETEMTLNKHNLINNSVSEGVLRDTCKWANFTVKGPPYFLTVVFIVRIYEKDLSRLTSLDVKHWLIYLRYAGVEHVYLYDLWYLPGESQREHLEPFIRDGYLTYEDRHYWNPYSDSKSQLPSYQHCIDKYGNDSVWQAAIDIDEYPFSPRDRDPGFLPRFVDQFSENNTDVSEITMNNFLYLGEKNESREYLFEKLWRHTHGPGNNLVKPIYKPDSIRRVQVHHNYLKTGHYTKTASSDELRMNHYWGPRLQNWGPDTEKILAMTEEDHGMKPIVKMFKACKKYFSQYL